VPVHHCFRDLDRGLVIVGFEPFAGRDFADPVEAIKPVARHADNPCFPAAAETTSLSMKRVFGELVSADLSCGRRAAGSQEDARLRLFNAG
jgi:hypothetical protein